MNKKRLLSFIKKHSLCVLATGNKGKPEASVVEFGETNELELIFDAFSSSRKVKNIRSAPDVAAVIGWDDNITVQYEGRAVELAGKELERCKRLYFAKNPKAREWEGKRGILYFKIKPRWIRYSDLNRDPWYIFETRDFKGK